MTIIKSKEAIKGLRITFLYDFSKLIFEIDKLTKEGVFFTDIKTGNMYVQTTAAFDNSRFIIFKK